MSIERIGYSPANWSLNTQHFQRHLDGLAYGIRTNPDGTLAQEESPSPTTDPEGISPVILERSQDGESHQVEPTPPRD